MPRRDYGAGRVARPVEVARLKHEFGTSIAPLDLNRAPADDFVRLRIVDRKRAAAIIAFRRHREIRTPSDLLAAGLINPEQLAAFERRTFGKLLTWPMLTQITAASERTYVGAPFALRLSFTGDALIPAEILSLIARFPSGWIGRADRRIDKQARERGSIEVGPFVSTEAGEFSVLATLRDRAGGVHRLGTSFGVFTSNPVRMYVTPSYWTQSGRVGAPKFDFGLRRWYCYADVRWVNGTDGTVNLGRRISVRMTDAGTEIGSFSFDLSSDIVIPPWSTIYGTFNTWHGEGSNAFNVFHAKGDLTFGYTMSGSGFSPVATQIWRTMRVIGYNIIRVGDFTANERNEYRRAAAEVASGIFQSRDMTVYGVELYRVEGTPEQDADKARFRFIDSRDELNELRRRYTVGNWYLDAFFVEGRWDGAIGSSPVNGPVDKEGNDSGLVIRRDSDTVNLGQTFAHEGGHYLGLEHADEDDGCADTDPADPNISDNFIFSSSRRDSVAITGCQIDKMRRHALVRSMTP